MLEWIDWMSDPAAWAALVTLTVMEIVLGIDNIVFISILADRLPEHQRPRARQLGLMAALVTRLLLLFSIAWLMGLTRALFEVFGHGVSGRDLVLGAGGLFLIYKATTEIHAKLEGEGDGHAASDAAGASFVSVIVQIGLLDVVFSLDSVITAVGMADDIEVMVVAIILAVGVMLLLVGAINRVIAAHPTIKMLALSFLMLIGVALVADGAGLHIPKGYIYFAMAFSAAVEMMNLRLRARRRERQIHT
ncbi:TerC family protein [Arhodomonas sp. AD133]|uniref:TerC family protein n=1 Tax=Arhodomonas sp. AD133 TaxID=3415009 RepID=UPI003EBDCA0B